ncbi:hypothetical protein K2173_022780 [Erythroxylum novogranatense]|uniref:Amine oxidase domain-containing protein n=1 Tax=Erythroxylum novogranatense TaxID=1862640 RepID=A0AAV8SNK8_9ROSI|nr:hypothetical protein K2173_022780 [Erythroxylum novogranatense]
MKKLGVIVFALVFHFFFAKSAASSSPSVIIVGAGVSGLAAAKTLHDAGINDFLILEALPRIGGRLSKANFSGLTVEMGANWIFTGGSVFNPIEDIAKKVNLKTSLNDFSNITAHAYKQDGGLYPVKVVDEVNNVADARDEYFSRLSKILSAKSKVKRDVDMSILSAQRLMKSPPMTPLEQVIDYYHTEFEDGEPGRVTSLKHTYPRNEFVDHGEDNNFVADPRGFVVVAQYMAKQFLSSVEGDPRLKLNKVVREVIYSKTGVRIKTEDGSVFNAKYAIVSVSLGVLQSKLIEFKPKLPLWKRVAISDFSMAIYTKIFMKFPYKFWPTGPGTEFFLYTHVRRGYYPFWQHLENEYPGSNILFVTVTYEESRRVEQLSDKEVEAEAMEILKKMFGKNIPKPVDILVPRWGMDRFFRGSYSNWPDSYSQHKHDQLGDPVGPVYFTGEHLSNKYIGYVDGAYLTGIDTANSLIGCIKNHTCKGFVNQEL